MKVANANKLLTLAGEYVEANIHKGAFWAEFGTFCHVKKITDGPTRRVLLLILHGVHMGQAAESAVDAARNHALHD